MRNLFQFVGLRHLRTKPLRTLLTTLGVALGVSLSVGIDVINRSTLASFRQNVEAVAGKTTLVITAGETGFEEEALEIARKAPGVKHAVPMVETRAYFAGDTTSSETLVVLGVDLLKEQSVRTYKTTDEQIIDDPLVFLNQPDSIIVTRSFAKENKLKIDDTFELATARGKQRFTVRGMLSPEGPAKAYGGSIAIMDIDGARMTFGKEGRLDRIDIVTKPGVDVDQAAQELRGLLGAQFQVDRPATQSENLEKMVKTVQTMLTFFSSLALLVGIFLVANSVSIAVAERKREIGTLRALGAERGGILALFMSEALAMGAIGALAGAFLGRAIASGLVGMISKSMTTQFLMKIEVPRLEFSGADVGRAMLLGGGAALLAALWPAYRATRIQPLEAMKNREVGEDAANRGMQRYGAPLGAALLIFLGATAQLGLGKRFPWLENFNQISSMVGCALFGPAIVGWLLKLGRGFFSRVGGTMTRLAQDNLLRNPRRTGSNVMSLMVGLILTIMIATISQSFRATVSDWFSRVVQADLIVSSTGQVISYQVQPMHEEIAQDLESVEGIKRGPDGRGAYGLRFVHVPYGQIQLGLKAYDAFDPTSGYKTLDAVDRSSEEIGRELFTGKDVVAVSENLVLHFGKKTGDTLLLSTPTGVKEFLIVGVVVDFASNQGVVYMDRRVYKRHWKDSLVTIFALRALPGFDPQALRKEIDQKFGRAKNLQVVANAELRNDLLRTIDQSFAYTHAIEIAALLVGLLGLLNTMLISVMERTRELGMLRAVGMTRGQLRRMILEESLFQGALGAVVAVLLGSFVAYFWVTSSLSQVLGWVIDFHFPARAVGITVLVGLFVALVAGYFPSRRAARIDIREALEYE